MISKLLQKNKRKIIFIGGSKGSGKHALAKRIQQGMENSIIIDKDGVSLTLKETLMEMYGKNIHNNVSAEYLYKVEPLEYMQLMNTIKHLIEMNNCNIIAIAPFFEYFSKKKWIEEITKYAKLHGYSSNFIFLNKVKDAKKSSKKQQKRYNIALRKKIDSNIATIKKNMLVQNYISNEIL